MTAPVRYRVPTDWPGNYGRLRAPRMGIMMHYDASASDNGAVEWLLFDPKCAVSYNWLILDDGTVRDIAPKDARAWHAGECKPSRPELAYRDANSAFYGVALAARPGDTATPAAFSAVVDLCVALMQSHGWTEEWRITSHRAEAWPRGRKDDPDGKLGVVLSVDAVRTAVLARLAPPPGE